MRHLPNQNSFLVFSLALLLSACASKQKTTSTPGYLFQENHPEQQVTRLNPVDPTATLPVPPEAGPSQPGEAARREKPRLALVIGGAGVASFATVGLLKRFRAEGIRFDSIVVTGWPALFAVGNCFLKSVHDLEWFAMRLSESDFEKIGRIGPQSDFDPTATLSKPIDEKFERRDLGECHSPVVTISASNTDLGDAEDFDKGEWKTPLVKTMSIPGLFRASSDKKWLPKAEALNVDGAIRRRSEVVVAIEMYDDFLDFLKKGKSPEGPAGIEFYERLRHDLNDQMEFAQVKGKIVLNKGPLDFSQKRLAAVLGEQEAKRLAKQIKALIR